MEAIGFLEALVRRLGHGWSARFGMIAPYGVYGLILTSDVGGTVEVVPSLVRGPAVVWSPFVFTRGTPHYDLHAGDRMLLRTPTMAEAVARLERWRQARGPAGRVAARLARVGSGARRPARTTEVDALVIGAGSDAVPARPAKPVAAASKSGAAAKPAAASKSGASKPKVAASKPKVAASKPKAAVSKPKASASKPKVAASKPKASASKPGKPASKSAPVRARGPGNRAR